MKNHIIFKFIAVILCAASLMGAVGSVAGIVALTEADLYNKTVDEVMDQRIEGNCTAYGRNLALMYASSELGGCPDAMVQQQFGSSYWFENSYGNFGYTIYDAEGNVLNSYNAELKETSSTYSVPVTGQYMHLVSVESETETAAREAAEYAARYGDTVYDFNGNPDIPAEGIALTSVTFLDLTGTPVYEATCDPISLDDDYDAYYYSYRVTYHYGSGSSGYAFDVDTRQTGRLFCNQYGELIYIASEEENFEPLPDTAIHSVIFTNDDLGFDFRMGDGEQPIGTLTRVDGIVMFQSYPMVSTVAETELATEPTEVIETVPETVPESVPETVPQEVIDATEATETVDVETPETWETSEEETTPVETAEETVPSSASAMPEEGGESSEEEAPAETEEVTEPPETTEAPTEPTVAETVPETVPEETIPEETVPETTEPVIINGKTLDNYQINQTEYHDSETQEFMTAKYVYVPLPEMTVEMYIDRGSLRDAALYDVLELVRQFRNYLLPAVGICLLLFAVFAVYLCTSAGRKPKSEEIRAGGLNRLPLDLYLFGGGFGIALIIAVGVEAAEMLLRQDFLVGCGFAVLAAFACCLIFVGFCFAFVAQIKTPDGFWWRNTLCGICIRLCARFAVWLEKFLALKGFPFLGRMCKKLWQFTCKAAVWLYQSTQKAFLWLGNKLGIASRWIGKKVHRFLSLLPLTWQWLIGGFVLIFIAALFINDYNSPNTVILGLVLCLAIVLYASHCFGLLAESTKRMSKGDLDTKVDDKLMAGCFKEFAGDLNNLADVAVVAAQKQLKSERMKTELITNVSHDIKTPLTSIINYVDLLQKPHTDAEQEQYLEVLDRQSQRLKKLIDDLMDMSKASTGNMAVEITQVDAVESVNQALGEFADKLDKAQLFPVFRHNEDSVSMMADGRLVWRVMSNLLSNAVKYAMPGTRLYIDLMTLEGKVIISLKNISRDELNVDADELMERFVRGDDSRNTEGSGLGLNIAKSLMELQKGQLQLLVDGDLFKVTLIFPGV